MTNSNLFQRTNCKFIVIEKEIETHECKGLKESRFENNIVWVSDGENGYPLKPPPPKINTYSHQRNSNN
ncbi:MAG: hypothetical protein WKF36_11000 [Candidatus Nitrosocosmicus sp.]